MMALFTSQVYSGSGEPGNKIPLSGTGKMATFLFMAKTGICLLLCLLLCGCYGDPSAANGGTDPTVYAATVSEYKPAPGQHLTLLGDPTAALGAPDGQVVSLGGFGGSITLRLPAPVIDRPGAPDFVVWGNAFYSGGDPRIRWAEPGLIEVSPDGSTWYLIGGGLFSTGNRPADNIRTVFFTNTNSTYWPLWATATNVLTFSNFCLNGVVLPRLRPGDSAFTNDTSEPQEDLYGYADCTPAGNPPAAGWVPDDPYAFGNSGTGGDAIMLEWAVDPAGEPVYESIRHLEFRYVRITTAIHASRGTLGEFSTEIDALGICP